MHAPDQAQSAAAAAQSREVLDQLLLELGNDAEHARGRRRWHRRYYEAFTPLLGIPATLLAAAAGVSALEDASATIVAVLSAASAALTATQTSLSPARRARANRAQEARFMELSTEARVYRQVRLPVHDVEHAADALLRMRRELSELMQQDPAGESQ